MRSESFSSPLLFALAILLQVAGDIPAAPAQSPQSATAAVPAATAKDSVGASTPKPAHTESWSTLALAGSGLPVSKFSAVLLGKSEQPQYTRELVRLQWRSGDPIDVYIVLPHGVSKPQPVLYLYDYKADSARFQNDGWCTRATQGGFAAVGFLSALTEERFHSPRPMKQWFVSELQESLATSTHDVQMILNYLASRGDIDVNSTGMIAQGSGGAIAILAASVDPRIVALDLTDPWGDWPDWLKDSPQIPSDERANYLKPEFLQKVSPLDPVLFLPRLKLKALRVQQIMDDPTTPAAARDRIAEALPKAAEPAGGQSVQLVRYKDRAEHQAAWRKDGLAGWMHAQLQPADGAQPASGHLSSALQSGSRESGSPAARSE
jgi:hypothetical protein